MDISDAIRRRKSIRGFTTEPVARETLRAILETGCYQLLCPPEMLEARSFADVSRVEQIALMILRKYVERYTTRAHRRWEQDQMVYRPLDGSDENLVAAYEARVKRSATEFVKTLRDMLEDPALYERDDGLPLRVHFDRHLYLPLLLEDASDEQVVKYSPPGLNPGERHFVEQLRAYVKTEEGQALLEEHDRELFLLRNQSRGRGVGFLVDNERFFPDFILWLIASGRQDIVFIDPHGLTIGSNLDTNPKVQFFKTIKEYERRLNEQAGRENTARTGTVHLHSYVISQTRFEDLRKQTGISSQPEFNRLHVYFREQPGYVESVMRDVLAG